MGSDALAQGLEGGMPICMERFWGRGGKAVGLAACLEVEVLVSVMRLGGSHGGGA